MSNSKDKSRITAVIGIFIAITVILQTISYFVKIGTFSITLTLIPIILAGALYGPVYSTVLGFSFGLVTVVGSITGVDSGGNFLFNVSPVRTILLCMVKAILCGFVAGIIPLIFKKENQTLSVIIAAVLTPVTNTGFFILFMFLFFKKQLYLWAGGTDIVTYIFVGLIGINFLIELLINVILSPVILRILGALKKYK